jgi:hypothetical protein
MQGPADVTHATVLPGFKQAATAGTQQRQMGGSSSTGNVRDQSRPEMQHHHFAAGSRIPQVLQAREADSWLTALTFGMRYRV